MPPGHIVTRLSYWIDGLLFASVLSLLLASSPPASAIDIFLALIVVPLWLRLFRFYDLYESNRLEGLVLLARKVLAAEATALVLAALLFAVCARYERLPLLAWFTVATTAAVLCEKLAVYSLLRYLRGRGYDRRNVCVIGSEARAREMADRFRDHAEWGSIVSCVGLGPAGGRRYYTYPDGAFVSTSIEEVLTGQVVDEVIVALPVEELPYERPTLAACEQFGVVGRVMVEAPRHEEPQHLEAYYGELTLAVGTRARDGLWIAVKRACDIVIATGLLILFAPVMLVTALLVKLSSRGPVIFSQVRVGLRGRQFRVYKFRTMVDGAETLLPSPIRRPAVKDPNDFRVTQLGRILRRFSLDELPQLFNVIKGDMSLVGPRPLVIPESVAITGAHRRRFSMRPGITCLREVNGRGDVDYATWMQYDLQYVDGWSLLLDCKLLLKTIPAVFTRRGAY